VKKSIFIAFLIIASAIIGCGDSSKKISDPDSSLPQAESSPLAQGDVSAPAVAAPFVDNYKTNTSTNMTESSNAVLSLLSGMDKLWTPGSAWNNGTVVNSDVLKKNVAYCVSVTTNRTDAQAAAAYYDDRRDQNYSMLSGLGPLFDSYVAQSGAVTTITSIPSDAVSVSYSDSGTGAGSSTSNLKNVVALIGTLRGTYASTTPAKKYFLYPRPWRLSENSIVVDTGTTETIGSTVYPVYTSNVVLVAALKPVRSTTPATDGGFASGHTNAAYLASFALAYAIPERYQELLTRASDLGNNRIVAGMHSPLDVIGGRVMATALAAATLYDSSNSSVKLSAYSDAHSYLEMATNTTDSTFYTFAHSSSSDSYADHDTNKTNYEYRLTYGFSAIDASTADVTVPKGAEALLETRFPYLTASQRRWVLYTTRIASGYPLLNDAEGWGRLNLFAAADGYAQFAGNVIVSMDASLKGFSASDIWRNSISGTGKLFKQGSGTLKLAGKSTFTGGVQIDGGMLEADSTAALGSGNVVLNGGTLAVNTSGALAVSGAYNQLAGSTLKLTLASSASGILLVTGNTGLAGSLSVSFNGYKPAAGDTVQVISGKKIIGTFDSVSADGWNVTTVYSSTGLKITFVSAK
jgi:autotransporter-associated beta strand protein